MQLIASRTRRRLVTLGAGLAAFAMWAGPAEASARYLATVPVGRCPQGIATNISTDTTYVANTASGTVSVISGSSNSVVASKRHRGPARGAPGAEQDAPAERARQAVAQAIKASMRKIAKYSPSLAHHLSTRVRTGLYCCYLPGPDEDAAWEA